MRGRACCGTTPYLLRGRQYEHNLQQEHPFTPVCFTANSKHASLAKSRLKRLQGMPDIGECALPPFSTRGGASTPSCLAPRSRTHSS